MALNTSKCNSRTPLHFKGLMIKYCLKYKLTFDHVRSGNISQQKCAARQRAIELCMRQQRRLTVNQTTIFYESQFGCWQRTNWLTMSYIGQLLYADLERRLIPRYICTAVLWVTPFYTVGTYRISSNRSRGLTSNTIELMILVMALVGLQS